MSHNQKVKDPDRIGIWEKWSHFLVNMGNAPVQSIIGSFLLIFYVNVCGMDPAAVATLFLITKLLDSFNDPILGYIIDHLPVLKSGRFRPYVVIGMVILSVNFALLFVGPAFVPGSWKLTVAYITYICIGITFDFSDIPKNATFITATYDQKQRSSLTVYKSAGMLLGGLIGGIIGAPIIQAGATELGGYMMLIFVIVAIMLVCTIAGITGIKERVKRAPDEEKYKIRDTFKILVQKPTLISLLASLLFNLNLAISTGIGAFYATYVLGDLSHVSIYTALTMIGTLPAIVICPLFARKADKKNVVCVSFMFTIVSTIMRLINPGNMVLFYLSAIVAGVSVGGFIAVIILMSADNNDYIEQKMFMRAEGATQSLSSFITKTGSAFGSAIPGYVLAFTGFVANAPEQNQQTLSGINICMNWIPMGLVLMAMVAIFFHPLTNKKMEEIQGELFKRKNIAAKSD